uniref:Granulocyte-macrophage colony-stimulating factor receptor subunit alpha-like n=1 Tax=Panthera tigris altaica TaxID=74533 RepID=A0A8C9JBD0_PANTA
MGPLATTILFCMLLDPALPLTQEHQDVPTTEWVPSLNMKFDRRTMELSWDCKENTTYLECVMIHKEKGEIRKKNKDCHCNFSHDSLHGGITFVVKVNSTQGPIPEKLVYANPGGEGTAAQNFSCFIYNVNFMNCTWAKGRAAPDDVQYFLYILDFKECPHYVTDSGTHVGCHLHDLSGLTFRNYFLVNGTSRETAVQFFDTILSLKNIGENGVLRPQDYCKLQPCDTVTSDQPLWIDVTGKSENKYNFPSPEPRPKHTVTIRVSDARGQHWSAWSQPVEFGCLRQRPYSHGFHTSRIN